MEFLEWLPWVGVGCVGLWAVVAACRTAHHAGWKAGRSEREGDYHNGFAAGQYAERQKAMRAGAGRWEIINQGSGTVDFVYGPEPATGPQGEDPREEAPG